MIMRCNGWKGHDLNLVRIDLIWLGWDILGLEISLWTLLLENCRSFLKDPYFNLFRPIFLRMVYHRAKLVNLEWISIQSILVTVFEITCHIFKVVFNHQFWFSKAQTVVRYPLFLGIESFLTFPCVKLMAFSVLMIILTFVRIVVEVFCLCEKVAC